MYINIASTFAFACGVQSLALQCCSVMFPRGLELGRLALEAGGGEVETTVVVVVGTTVVSSRF